MTEQEKIQPESGGSRDDNLTTFKATPEQASRLLELGAISEGHYRQAQAAGGLLVRVPANLVEEFRQARSMPVTPTHPDPFSLFQSPENTLPDEEAELEKLACWLHSAGLNAPARLFLSSNKPLSFVTSQVLLAAQPMTRLAFGPRDITGQWSRLLEKRSNVDILIGKLEQLEAGTGGKHRKGKFFRKSGLKC